MKDYDEAIRLDPSFYQAFYNRGLAKEKMGDAVGSDADLVKARKLQSSTGE